MLHRQTSIDYKTSRNSNRWKRDSSRRKLP